MKVLLDTHVFLWWNADDPHLSSLARQIISDGENELFLSVASAWEIAIKTARGRLTLPEPPPKYLPSRMMLHRILSLPIQASHALHTYTLPEIHKDPFDRILIAQCQLENLPLITSDEVISQYDIHVIW